MTALPPPVDGADHLTAARTSPATTCTDSEADGAVSVVCVATPTARRAMTTIASVISTAGRL
ncbi:MAG: hypothetical protein ACYC5Z_07745 [Acidimicrobiales bacterium]